MIKIEKKLDNFELKYDFGETFKAEDLLFMDIETTGFTARSSQLYLIGCIYYKDDCFNLIQWFADSAEDESYVLNSFLTFIKGFKVLVHFNGNHFDLPYLEQKASMLGIPFDISFMTGIDIYQRIHPFKGFLRMASQKQKKVEEFLGINREDTYTGGELVTVYHEYLGSPTEYNKNLLLLHNEDDIKGLVNILPVLSYSELLEKGVIVTKVNANYYTDYNGEDKGELIMKLKLPSPIPVSVSSRENEITISARDDEALLKVPIYSGELKYFYSDYKSYYYLPGEDTALHKSVAAYVDKQYREQATARNCYTRKEGEFLPEFSGIFEPIFKKEYESDELFFELTTDFKKDREAFATYASHLVQMMIIACK